MSEDEPKVDGEPEWPPLTEDERRFALDLIRKEQNLSRGILSGLGATVLSAIIWGLLSYSTGYQIGYMAVLLGIAVGMTVRLCGKGLQWKFGIAGASLAVFGCILGNLMTVYLAISSLEQLSFYKAVALIPITSIPGILVASTGIFDLLMYTIAFYEAYVFSFRKVTEYDLLESIRVGARSTG